MADVFNTTVETTTTTTSVDELSIFTSMNVASTSAFSDSSNSGTTRLSVILGPFMFVVVIVSALANLFVLLSYAYEKKLRTTFSILIANLALTDFIISVIPMNFYTIDIVSGYWPLGKVICGLWVVVDYNTVFASTYTLAAISIDRLWSIKWSINYRQNNTKRKAGIIVAIVWFSVFAVAMYPTISDRVLRTRDRQCEFVPAENPNFVVALAVLGHHVPCLIITISYVIVYLEIRKLIRTRPQDKFKAATAAAKAASSRAGPSTSPANEASTVIVVKPRDNQTVNDEQRDTEMDETSVDVDTTKASSKSRETAAATTRPPPAGRSNAATASTTATSNGGGSSNHDRERKTFVTLSYIVFAYVFCWVPFHFIYDVSFIRPDVVPQQLFVALFWMTYVNSLLNPFLYAFSSADVRTAVKKMMLCQFKKLY